jgi:HisA/HisF family protein
MQEFAVIPVIDLKGGSVVHARAGNRADYRPIETPLGAANDPGTIARALLAITGGAILYVADLDAIAGDGDHFRLCQRLADALPGIELWIDAGFADAAAAARWRPLGATLVVGSESLLSVETWQDLRATFGQSLVLSLDFTPDGFLGAASLLSERALWPDQVIVMSLGRVGTNAGPDIVRLKVILELAGARAVFAAGGVRDVGDLAAVVAAGAQGAVIATALHTRALTQNEIAAFLRKRRSRS